MDRIQALVEKLPQEVDGALITSTVNRHYFTGLRSSAGVLLVTRKGCSALLDFRYIEVARRTIQSCEVILQEKLEAGQYSAEDTLLFEALGGVWKLEDLGAIGSVREQVRLVQDQIKRFRLKNHR